MIKLYGKTSSYVKFKYDKKSDKTIIEYNTKDDKFLFGYEFEYENNGIKPLYSKVPTKSIFFKINEELIKNSDYIYYLIEEIRGKDFEYMTDYKKLCSTGTTRRGKYNKEIIYNEKWVDTITEDFSEFLNNL